MPVVAQANITPKLPRSQGKIGAVSTFTEDDPKHPRNWPQHHKWVTTILVSSICFMTPATSSMVAPGLSDIAKDLNIPNDLLSQMVLSIFVLGLGIGPMFFGPLSEIYGRVPVLLVGNLFYLLFNTVCGVAQNYSQLLAFRFLAGFGGAAPLVVGSGIIADLFQPEERGKAIALYNVAPLLSPSVGPIVGAFVLKPLGWQWIFYIVSIGDACLQVLGWIFVRETYVPVLLKTRRKNAIKTSGNTHVTNILTPPSDSYFSLLKRNLLRAAMLLVTQPIIQILAIYLAYVYGLIYLAFSTFPILWTNVYGESVRLGSLNYISLGLGYVLGSVLCGMFSDRIYRHLSVRHSSEPSAELFDNSSRQDGHLSSRMTGTPEYKLPLLFVATTLIPAGLFWYGWTAQTRQFWLLPNIGAVIFSAGISTSYQCINGYIVDAYSTYAASAVSAVILVRNIPGFAFPLFAPAMYNKLGFGWGNSLLAFLAIGLGMPATLGLWILGPKLRAKSGAAKGDVFNPANSAEPLTDVANENERPNTFNANQSPHPDDNRE